MIRFKVFILISVLLVLSGCARSGAALLNATAKTNDYIKKGNIEYGPHHLNRLDVYRPNNSSKPHAVIVFFYGGCWGECNSLNKSDYLFVAQSFASRGITTVIADFRQYPEVNFATLMEDASKVVSWTSMHISEFGGDPNRIIVSGHSSGAHIASMLALNPRYLKNDVKNRVRGFIGMAGPYDFLPLDEVYQRKLFNPSNDYASSQPINFVSAQSPPLLILQGEKDETVGKHNALNLSRKAQSLGISQQLILYPKLDHIGILTALSRPFQGQSTVLKDILDFIQLNVK